MMSSTIPSNPDDILPSYQSTRLTATCHCGQITLLLPHPPTSVTECQCSVCYRYGVLWAYYARTSVLVTAEVGPLRPQTASTSVSTDDAKVRSTADTEGKGAGSRKYIREGEGLGELEFNFCGKCGCVTHWWAIDKEEDGEAQEMGVNARMLDPVVLEGVQRIVSKGP